MSKKLIPNADQTFFENVPENIDYCKSWWSYAKYVPKDIYSSLLDEAAQNTAAYKILWGAIYYRGFSLHNLLKVEMLSAPDWRGRNSIIANSDLNALLIPKVFICNTQVKASLKNLPADFTQKTSFRLTVKQLAAVSGLTQILEADDDDATVWRRHSADGGKTWGGGTDSRIMLILICVLPNLKSKLQNCSLI